jgi:hypothetical protein
MEWHPLNTAPFKVQLGLLVDELGYSFPAAHPDEVPSSTGGGLHQHFPETNHVVSYAFLDYFRDHGEVNIFGYPRSEFIYEGGRVVQYFQRARMEWHPEKEVGAQISLANLGEIYVERFGIPGDYDDPVPPPQELGEGALIAPRANQGVTGLELSASVRYAITGRQGTQTLTVYVDDQQRKPVKGAAVSMVARYPSNRQPLALGRTNERGFTRGSFEILPTPPGERVIIDVTVTFEDLEETTQTFFVAWW